MSYTTTVSNNSVTLTLTNPAHTLSLSRTGGQGTKGDSVTDVTINANSELVVTISNAAGSVVETINAGNLFQSLNLVDIADVIITNIQDGEYIAYDSSDQKYKNHTLTTTKITDIDNTNKTDGAILIYNGSSSKYAATTNIDNANTAIIGGTF
jgi:uncharacterized protein YjiK